MITTAGQSLWESEKIFCLHRFIGITSCLALRLYWTINRNLLIIRIIKNRTTNSACIAMRASL